MTLKKIVIILFFIPLALNAQENSNFDDSGYDDSIYEDSGYDDSGFGLDDVDFGFSGSPRFSLNIGGEVRAELTGFNNDFSSGDSIKNSSLGDIFSGSLNFHAASSAAEAVINLNIIPAFDGNSPLEINEAYVRAFFGQFIIEGGLRKLSWGKADSFGPLDVINPVDFSDLTKLSDPQNMKIARPLIRGIMTLGDFSRLEAVFVPSFRGHSFASSGRWAPSQITDLAPSMISGLKNTMLAINPGLTGHFPSLDAWQESFNIEQYYWDNKPTLNYAQAGLRYTSSIGSSDIGFQYYFGRFPRPAVRINLDDYLLDLPASSDPDKISIDIDYNTYHQIGADFARVLAGFNLRAEAAVNLTGDMNGTDGTIENPAFLWSLGFDRDLVWGINLNLQGTGNIKLFHSKINDNPLSDIEAGTNVSSTRITGILSRKFLRDELELKAIGLWGIEDRDYLIMPALIWTKNDVSTELSAGFFGGDKNGELGQYRDNSFFRMILTYTF